ncbi:MAG: type II secretion system protein N [Gammaproteobacteria bacterium]|nr:type II secretion system protein N [Gammaproteobacteria bacterium]
MKRRHWAILALAVFLGTAIAHAPVAYLHAWLRPAQPQSQVQPYGLHGTLAHGRIAALTVKGRAVAQNLEWELLPSHLALLRLGVRLKGEGEGTLVEGVLSWSLGGGLRVQDMQAVTAIGNLMAAAGVAYVPIEARARLQVRSLKLDGGRPVAAAGTLDVAGLAWTLARDPVALGDFRAEVETKGSDIVAQLSSPSGPLELSGDAKLAADGNYELHMQFKARPSAEAQVQELIRAVGQPDTRGYYHIRRSGKLS